MNLWVNSIVYTKLWQVRKGGNPDIWWQLALDRNSGAYRSQRIDVNEGGGGEEEEGWGRKKKQKKNEEEEEERRRRVKKYSTLLSIRIEGNQDTTNNQHVWNIHRSSPEVPVMFFWF